MIGAGISLVVVVVLLGAIGTGIYVAVRGAGGSESLGFRTLLRAYLRVAFLVSLGVFMVGAVWTLTAGMGAAFGNEFSYRAGYGGSSVCTGADKSQLTCTNTPGRGDDPRPRDDLIRGLSVLVAGLVIGVGHRVGQVWMESREERLSSGLARAEYLVGTVIFGLVSIIALPAAVYALLSYYLVSHSAINDAPGPNVAIALVFTPAWGIYLASFVRRVRSRA